jgi:hypothetical protein
MMDVCVSQAFTIDLLFVVEYQGTSRRLTSFLPAHTVRFGGPAKSNGRMENGCRSRGWE